MRLVCSGGDRPSIRGYCTRKGSVSLASRPLGGWWRRVAPLAMARMVPDGPDHFAVPGTAPGRDLASRLRGSHCAGVGHERSHPGGGWSTGSERELHPVRVERTNAGHFPQEESRSRLRMSSARPNPCRFRGSDCVGPAQMVREQSNPLPPRPEVRLSYSNPWIPFSAGVTARRSLGSSCFRGARDPSRSSAVLA